MSLGKASVAQRNVIIAYTHVCVTMDNIVRGYYIIHGVTRELYKIYCEMAEAAVEVCVACAQLVPREGNSEVRLRATFYRH